jgi:hypothetical protein
MHTVPDKNSMFAIPLVATLIESSSVFTPAIYEVVIDIVSVILPDVLLTITIASPAANVEFGTVTLPPEPTTTICPTSVVARV